MKELIGKIVSVEWKSLEQNPFRGCPVKVLDVDMPMVKLIMPGGATRLPEWHNVSEMKSIKEW